MTEDVQSIRLTWWRSAILGYSVLVFRVRNQLIDTGFPGARLQVGRLIAETRPAGVIVTHQHEDHAGNVAFLAQRGLPMAIPRVTEQALRAGEADVRAYRRFCWGSMPPLAARIEPYEPNGLDLIFLPGHSPDHHAVWDAERETLFCGDLYLGGRVRVARPMEDPRMLAQSLRRAAGLRPRRVFDSHRGLLPNGADALRDKASWLEHTIDRIDDRVARGWDDHAIARDVLGRRSAVEVASRGDLSRTNFVRAVRATAAKPAAADRETARGIR